jgi:hypothetical protein
LISAALGLYDCFVPKAVIQNYVMYGLILGIFAQYVEVDPSLHEETP